MVILTRCCNYDENSRIFKTAWEIADEENVANTNKPWGEDAVPQIDHDWDPNRQAGKEAIAHMIFCMSRGMVKFFLKPVIYNKIWEII